MKSQEHSFCTQRAHISLGGVSRPFRWELVQDAFAEAKKRLSEGSSSSTVPRRYAVLALGHGVDDQRRVLDHPRCHRVVERDGLIDAIFKTELNGSEHPSDDAHTDLGQTIALGVIGGRLLFANLLNVATFCFCKADCASHHSPDGGLAI